jgi:putative nucleotidyltransferase with HDIG domain
MTAIAHVSSGMPPDEILPKLASISDSERVWLGTFSGRNIHLVASYPQKHNLPASIGPDTEGVKDVIRLGKPVEIANPSNQTLKQLLPTGKRFLIVPLKYQTTIGILALAKGDDRPFGTPMTNLILSVGEILTALMLSARYRDILKADISDKTHQIQMLREDINRILTATLSAMERTTDETAIHCRRVAEVSQLLAELTGMPTKFTERIHMWAHLHDIGKLSNPGVWSKDKPNQQTIVSHTTIGVEMFRDTIDEVGRNIILYHHENWDGTGYHGLSEYHIPIEARIVRIADAFVSLTEPRTYREALKPSDALKVITRGDERFGPNAYDPILRATLEKFFPRFERIFKK